MSEVERISYKTVSKAELGLAQSHMTHIGFAENTFDDWKKRISIKTNLNIFFGKNYRSEILTLLINDPIKHPKHGFRSPKFRSGSDSELSSLRDSIVYYYKLNMRDDSHTPIFILPIIKLNKLSCCTKVFKLSSPTNKFVHTVAFFKSVFVITFIC